METKAGGGRGALRDPGTARGTDGGGRSGDAGWFWILLVAVVVGLAAGAVAAWPSGRTIALAILVAVLVELVVAAVLAAAVRIWRWVEVQRARTANGAEAGGPTRRQVSIGGLLALGTALAVLVSVNVVRPDEVDGVQVPSDSCGRAPARDAIEVMVVWDDEAELGAFCDVVGEYIRSSDGGHVWVTSAGVDVGARLQERLARRDPPDVAILPQPSLVRELAVHGQLRPIEEEVTERFPAAWNVFVTEQEDGRGAPHVYGAIVKGALKSVFWYRPVELGNDAGIEPEDWAWDDFTSWMSGHLASDSEVPPLTMGAADKWTLTDWFENQLAGNDPQIYSDLARGRQANGDDIDWDAVHQAWEESLNQMADLWETPGLFAGGRGDEGVRETHWQELADQLYDGEAEVMFGPSFLAGRVDAGQEGSFRLYPFGFPTLAGGRPLVVGGDMAVVPKAADHPLAAEELVDWLTGEDAPDLWARADRGYLTPSSTSPHLLDELSPPDNEEDLRIWLTDKLRHPEGDLHFDLSDDQLTVANQDNPHRSWEIFAAFFDDVVTARIRRGCAVDRTIARLTAEYQGQEWPAPETICAR